MRETIRKIMISQGCKINNRPYPEIYFDVPLENNCYFSTGINEIHLYSSSSVDKYWKYDVLSTLSHELCHSLQYIPKNVIMLEDNRERYFSQPHEIEAYKIGFFFKELFKNDNFNPMWCLLDRKPCKSLRRSINKSLRELKELYDMENDVIELINLMTIWNRV